MMSLVHIHDTFKLILLKHYETELVLNILFQVIKKKNK